MLHSKGLRGSIKLERNARKYHNQTNCKEVSKVLQGSITIRKNACDYHDQNVLPGVQQSKELPGIPQLKGLPRSIIIKTTTGDAKIKRTARKDHNQKDCEGVPQTKLHPESHKQMNCNDV